MQPRPSSARLLAICARSHDTTDTPIDSPSPYAARGTAVHSVAAMLVRGDEPDLRALAAQLDQDADDLTDQAGRVRDALLILRPYGGDSVAAEEPLASTELGMTGTADAVLSGPNQLLVIDWKTGHQEKSATEQLGCYAQMARERWGIPACGHITTAVVYLGEHDRSGAIQVEQWTQDRLDGIIERHRDLVSHIGSGTYNPGEHCSGEYCRRRNGCPALREWNQHALASLRALYPEGAEPAELERSRIGELYPQVKAVRKLIESYDAVLRNALAAGPLNTGDGRHVELSTVEQKAIDPSNAWPVFLRAVGADNMPHVVSVSTTKALKIIRANAERGQKKAAEEKFIAALEDAGAISWRRETRIQPRKGEVS